MTFEADGPNRRSLRNVDVERAVRRALDRIDYFIGGGTLEPPSTAHIHACDELLARKQAGSAKAAALTLIFYWLEQSTWDRDSVPVGIQRCP